MVRRGLMALGSFGLSATTSPNIHGISVIQGVQGLLH